MTQRFFPEFNMQRYEEEDSDHSVNGWIKKEIVEEEDDMEEFLKHGQETDPGDHYENLMSLSKEELVGKVLQLEEDIRYLQDIRNGFEKSVQELSATAAQYQTLINNLLTLLSSLKVLKEQQSATVSTAGDSSMPVSSTISSTRPSDNNARVTETSPGSTPSSSSNNITATSLASPKMVPTGRNNARITESTTQSFMTSSNVLPVKERTHVTSVNTQSTVTITRSTNLIIKTEIPSPPPEPEIIENPMEMTPNMSLASYPKKRKYDGPQPFQSQQQQHSNSSSNASSGGFSPIQTTARPAGQRAKVNMAMPQQHAQRPRMSANVQSGPRGSYQMPNMQAQMRQPQPVQNVRMPTPRFARNNPRMSMRGRGNVQDVSFPNPMQRGGPRVQQMNMPNAIGRPRQSTVKITPLPTTTASSSPVNNVLADLAAKMPHISLSLVQPGGGISKGTDNGSRSMTIKPTEERSAAMASSTFTNSNTKSGGKAVASNQLTASSTQNSNQTKTVNINFGDDDDDENDYDEIAVLIPDKKNPIAEEDSNPSTKNSQSINKKQSRSSEMFAQETFSANWAPQNASIDLSNQNATTKIYHNNDEYMFDDPLDDTDIEENDSKFYLGEDVNLPKEVVDACIKSSSNGDQLTQKLMEALFPDLAQVAANCNIDGNKAYSILPTNKVNAIIGLVQQRFPLKTRKEILGIVNGKFQEAKVSSSRNSRPQRGVQYKNY